MRKVFNWFKKFSSKIEQSITKSKNLVRSDKLNVLKKSIKWTDLDDLVETAYFYPTVNVYDDSTVEVSIEVDVPRRTFMHVYKSYEEYYTSIRAKFRNEDAAFNNWLKENNLTLVDVTFKVIK